MNAAHKGTTNAHKESMKVNRMVMFFRFAKDKQVCCKNLNRTANVK